MNKFRVGVLGFVFAIIGTVAVSGSAFAFSFSDLPNNKDKYYTGIPIVEGTNYVPVNEDICKAIGGSWNKYGTSVNNPYRCEGIENISTQKGNEIKEKYAYNACSGLEELKKIKNPLTGEEGSWYYIDTNKANECKERIVTALKNISSDGKNYDSTGLIYELCKNATSLQLVMDGGKLTDKKSQCEAEWKIIAEKYDFTADHNDWDNYLKGIDSAIKANNEKLNEDKKTDESAECKGMGFFGFIFCPILSLAANAIDGILGNLKEIMSKPLLIKNGNNIKHGWNRFVSIANIILIIIFLVVIYATAMGGESGILSNYNVKKILPKLIAMAIAINISYYICMLINDFMNILGGGTYDLVYNALKGDGGGAESWNLADIASGITSTIVAGGATAGAFAVFGVPAIALFAVLGVLTMLLALLVIYLMVSLRWLILIVLIVISPLAFCAAILPNTEKLFKQWATMFIKLLLIYPAFCLVWGACRGATVWVVPAAADGGTGLMGIIMYAALMVAPLFVIKPLFKGAGALMATAAGAIAGNGLMKAAQGGIANGNKMASKMAGEGTQYRKAQLSNSALGQAVGNSALGNLSRGRRLKRGAALEKMNRQGRLNDAKYADANGIDLSGDQAKALMDDYKIQYTGKDKDELLNIAMGKNGENELQRAAAMEIGEPAFDDGENADIIQNIKGVTKNEDGSITMAGSVMLAAAGKVAPSWASGETKGQISQGAVDDGKLNNDLKEAVEGGMTAEKLMSMSKSDIRATLGRAKANKLLEPGSNGANHINDLVATIQSDPKLKAGFSNAQFGEVRDFVPSSPVSEKSNEENNNSSNKNESNIAVSHGNTGLNNSNNPPK